MKVRSIISVVLLLCVAIYIYTGCRPVWQFDHLERNARKVVTAPELQAWATNLLARHPEGGGVRSSELSTDFPEALRGLAPKLGPVVYIHEANGTNWPAYVQVTWGSGFLGAHGFEIGQTNFIGFRSQRVWQPGVPGVYFY